MEARIVALEEKLEEATRQRDTSLSLLPSRMTDLEQQVEEAVQSRNKDRTETQIREEELRAQLLWLHRLYDTLDDAVISGERAVGLSLTEQNLVPTLTRYGTFLFKLAGCDKADKGYDLHLRVTNVTSFRIHRFRLHGEFGRKGPALPPGATIRQRMDSLDAWELSLAKFEQTFDLALEPGETTPLVLRVGASRLADLEFIRLWMDVHAVSLTSPRSPGSFATFDASRPEPSTLHVLPSEAGTFYLKLEKTTPVAGGQQLTFRFGNPLGMTIDKIRLHGTLGKKPPPPAGPNDPPGRREQDLLEWRQSRRPFSKDVRATIKPMQWSEITLDLPAATPADLAHVECRVDVQEIHLLQKGN